MHTLMQAYKKAVEQGDYDKLELMNEIVHDVANQIASSINNNGPQAQLEFLMENMSITEVEETLKEIME